MDPEYQINDTLPRVTRHTLAVAPHNGSPNTSLTLATNVWSLPAPFSQPNYPRFQPALDIIPQQNIEL